MKRALWNVTVASVITLAAYILLSFIWLSLMNFIKNESVKLFAIALMTAAAFSFFLVYKGKIRGSCGEKELLSDYRDRQYIGLIDDLKLIFRRERIYLVAICVIIALCFLLNTLDNVLFGKKVISFPTFPFAPMCLFSTCIPIPIIGYAVSAILDYAFYLLFLLLYRRRHYAFWMKNKD